MGGLGEPCRGLYGAATPSPESESSFYLEREEAPGWPGTLQYPLFVIAPLLTLPGLIIYFYISGGCGGPGRGRGEIESAGS